MPLSHLRGKHADRTDARLRLDAHQHAPPHLLAPRCDAKPPVHPYCTALACEKPIRPSKPRGPPCSAIARSIAVTERCQPS